MSKPYSLNAIGREFRKHTGCSAGSGMSLRRAAEELCEARAEFEGPTLDLQALADEMADVILSLAASGLDLDAAIARKHARNMGAGWIRNRDGSVKRVKGGAK